MDPEDVRQLLVRAEEIQHQQAVGLEARPEVLQLVEAATEAGLDRDAVLQALRERISVTERKLEPGDLVFAPSTDGNLYVATVKEVTAGSVAVKFLNGGETTLAAADLRPFAILSGQELYCPWPNWGWWKCDVVSYDADNRKVTVSDGWMSQMTFHLSDVRLKSGQPSPLADKPKQWVAMLAIALASGGLGALLMRLLTR